MTLPSIRLAVLGGLLVATSALAVPTELTQQGRLLDSTGVALSGAHDLTFVLYDAPSGGAELWTETLSVDLDNGSYSAVLGQTNALDSSIFDGATAHLGIAVDGGAELSSRIAVVSVPYAIRAGSVVGLVDATELRVNGELLVSADGELLAPSTGEGSLGGLACTDGDAPVFDGTAWGCAPNETAHTTDASALTTGTLDIARLPIGTTADTVAAGEHSHSLADLGGTLDASQLPTDFADQVAAANGTEADDNPLNHVRYDDADALAAMGDEADDNPLNHVRYDDADALAAMGDEADDNPLNHARYTDDDAVAAVVDGMYHRLSGRYIKLFGDEITISGNNAAQANPRLNINATRANRIGSVSFELIGSNHCGYCYSGGPKAIIWNNGNVPFTFWAVGDSVYLEMDASNSVTIRSSYPIAPSAVSAIPSGARQVGRMN